MAHHGPGACHACGDARIENPVPDPAILVIHMITCRGCGQRWAGEELDIAGIRFTAGQQPCGCVCSDPADPHYEDWVIDRA